MNFGIVSVLPIFVCLAMIFIFRNAFYAIGAGALTALLIIVAQTGRFVLPQALTEVITSSSTLKTIGFILLVGALVSAMDKSGGVRGMIAFLEKKNVNISSKIGVQLFTMLIGVLMFVDATSSMAMTSVVGKPLFNKAHIKTEKLALIVNSTSSPIAWLIPFGGAGALTAGLLSQFDEIGDDAFMYVIKAVPFHFYTIVLLLLLVVTVLMGKDFGPINKLPFEEITENESDDKSFETKSTCMVLPIVSLLFFIALILLVTGKGNILKGDSSGAVFYSAVITLVINLLYMKAKGFASVRTTLGWYLSGIKSMLMISLLLVIAFIFSNLLSKVGTADYLIGLFTVIKPQLLPLIAFILSAVISFSTGTSGGTVAVVTGIIIPMALMKGLSVPLVTGAIISGSVFGDQNSVISDTVILTSSLTGVNTLTHVRTQLPYTLTSLVISAGLYAVAGFAF